MRPQPRPRRAARRRAPAPSPAPRLAAERARRRAGRERLALRGEVAGRAERLARRPARRAGRSPGDRRRPPARIRRPEPRAPRSRTRGPRSRSDPVVGAAVELRPDHQLGRDLEQEPRRDAHPAAAPGRPPPGVRQEQPPLRPRDPDVGEPALLLELLLVVERPAVREQALLEAGDEHDRELEALRRVERDQRDRVGVALVRVLVGDERGLLEQPVERVLRATRSS